MNGTTDYDRYETPEVLVTDRTLSAAQKLARLEQWEEDLKAAMRATDDSMTSVNPGLSGALLQRVMACWSRCGVLRSRTRNRLHRCRWSHFRG